MKTSPAPKEKAGVIVYRRVDRDEPLVLVVTARKFKDSWVFPVGSAKKGESLQAAAKRECVEEAGYYVDLGLRLPAVEVSEGEIAIRFTFFLATVVGDAAQWETDRKREWLPVSRVVDALPAVFHGVAREAVERLTKMRPN